MSAVPQRRILRTGDGRIAVRLAAREREILGGLASVLAAETAGEAEPEGGPADRGLARLWPDAVRGDSEASTAFRELTAADLEASRQDRFALLASTIENTTLDEAEASAWLGAVNDLRLVHGTRLAVTEATGTEPIDDSDPESAQLIVFLWLGWVEEQLVDALAAGLPDVPDPDEDA